MRFLLFVLLVYCCLLFAMWCCFAVCYLLQLPSVVLCYLLVAAAQCRCLLFVVGCRCAMFAAGCGCRLLFVVR